MRTREVAAICGVTERTVTGNAKKAGVTLENGKIHNWTEDEVKKLQLVLMANTQNRGNASTLNGVVEDTARNALQGGLTLQELIKSGNVEAMIEFNQICLEAVKETARNKQLEAENKLLIEQKEAAEAESQRIYMYNKNFHNNLYTASQIAKKLCISSNKVGRIANEHNLKQEPIYGKLGKIQLSNGQWVNQFYYNEDALTVIKALAN